VWLVGRRSRDIDRLAVATHRVHRVEVYTATNVHRGLRIDEPRYIDAAVTLAGVGLCSASGGDCAFFTDFHTMRLHRHAPILLRSAIFLTWR